MITVSATSGQQIEGIRIDAPIEAKLMANLSDSQKVEGLTQFIRNYLAIVISGVDGIPLDSAVAYVNDNTEIIS